MPPVHGGQGPVQPGVKQQTEGGFRVEASFVLYIFLYFSEQYFL